MVEITNNIGEEEFIEIKNKGVDEEYICLRRCIMYKHVHNLINAYLALARAHTHTKLSRAYSIHYPHIPAPLLTACTNIPFTNASRHKPTNGRSLTHVHTFHTVPTKFK